jgi:hypothetical protein
MVVWLDSYLLVSSLALGSLMTGCTVRTLLSHGRHRRFAPFFL